MTDGPMSIRAARPKLRLVSPLTASIMRGYSVINLFLGVGLFFTPATAGTTLAIINNVFTFQFWGLVFILLGIVNTIAYMRNDWDLMRTSLVMGIVVKFTWAIALILELMSGRGSPLILFLWLFFAYIQWITYIYFVPNIKQKE